MAGLIYSCTDDNISVMVRSPESGERQPESLLPIPATDEEGRLHFLYSSLVIDWRDERIVIPDIWEPGWLSLDLARGMQDLAAGGPLSVGYLDGSAEGSGLPVSLLQGRWRVSEWLYPASPAQAFDILLIRGGPELDKLEGLKASFKDYLASGGRILFSGSAVEPMSGVGEWASLQAEGSNLLFIDDNNFLDPTGYEEGRRSFRDIDTALILAVGRRDLIEMMASDVRGIEVRGRGEAGSRLLKVGMASEKHSFPNPQDVKSLSFNDDLELFSLEKTGDGWIMRSGDWQLPARNDRIESFLERMKKGSENLWKVSDLTDSTGGSVIVVDADKNSPLILESNRERMAGGGVYLSTGGTAFLWPYLNAADISGDARYWMERRLFPSVSEAIRAELTSGSRLYWRLHEEAGEWIFTGRDGSRNTISSLQAEDYLSRLLGSESITVTPIPPEGMKESPLLLRVEDTGGRSIEYQLTDTGEGRVAAVSLEDGLIYVLDDTLVQFLLSGPVGE